MNTDFSTAPTRQAAVNGLAVVGFIALVVAGVWLAVYSTRFVPTVVQGVGAAAVYLGSLFTSESPSLSVVPSPSASTTLPFGTTTPSGSPEAETAPAITPKQPAAPAHTAATAPVLYGHPDLQMTVRAIGYLAIDGRFDSFVESASVPAGKQPAAEFTVRNIGTNISGTWQLTTDPKLAISHEEQPSLLPNAERDFVIYLDRTSQSSQALTATVVSSFVSESNTTNNSISLTLKLD